MLGCDEAGHHSRGVRVLRFDEVGHHNEGIRICVHQPGVQE